MSLLALTPRNVSTTPSTEDQSTPPTPILTPASPETISPVLRAGKLPPKKTLKRENAVYLPAAGSEAVRNYTLEEEKILKLLKNTKKAISEYYLGENGPVVNKENCPNVDKTPALRDIQKALKNEVFVTVEHAEKTDIGHRRTENQDALLFKETENYVLAAIFDGFGDYDRKNRSGKYIANFVKNHFEGHFERALSESGCPKIAIQTLFNEAQVLLDYHKVEWPGTTACVNFIDKRHGLLYTATLGDTQSFIVRFQEKAMIPNSIVRDWKSVKDRKAVAKYVNNNFNQTELKEWNDPKISSKKLKICRTNVSRAIGFGIRAISVGIDDHTALSRKGKCTINSLKGEDIVLIACDGLWDYANADDIYDILIEHQNDLSTAIDKLIALSKNNQQYGFESQREKKRITGSDNVTIIALKVKIDQTIQEPPLKKQR